MITSILLSTFWSVFTLIIWFSSDAFIEYSKLIGIHKIVLVDKYLKYKQDINPKVSYLSFLRRNHNSFFVRMISCISCFNFWISAIFCLIFSSLQILPVVYVISFVMYLLIRKKVINHEESN